MELLFYSQTIHIRRYTSPAGIPGNQTILIGPKNFKNCSGHNGKPKLINFTKNTPYADYKHYCMPLISAKTKTTIEKNPELKHKQRKLHQTKIHFA